MVAVLIVNLLWLNSSKNHYTVYNVAANHLDPHGSIDGFQMSIKRHTSRGQVQIKRQLYSKLSPREKQLLLSCGTNGKNSM